MKTLRYIFMGLMLFLFIPVCHPQTPLTTKQVITLQTVTEHATDKQLSASKEILLRRLAAIGIRDASITRYNGTSGLIITVGDTISRATLSDLMLIQGHMSLGESIHEQDLKEAHGDFTDPGNAVLCVILKEEAWKRWEDVTISHKNQPVDFVIDNKVYGSPRIADKIPHGQISLSGSGFSKVEVRKLAAILSGGTLPLKFTMVHNH